MTVNYVSQEVLEAFREDLRDERKLNAELLEALESFKAWAIKSGQYDKTDGCYMKACAAISKAKS